MTAAYQPLTPRGPAPTPRHDPPRTEVRAGYQPPGTNSTDALALWQQETDLGRWSLPIDEGGFGEEIPFLPTVPLPGVLWTHTAGDGDASSPDFDDSIALLSSHYWSGPIDAPFGVRAPSPCHRYVGPFLGHVPSCPMCSATFPAPFLGEPGVPGFRGCQLGVAAAPVLRLPFGSVDAAPVFSRDPAEVLDVPGRWVSAAEPDGWLPESGIRYVAVNALGDTLERVLVKGLDGRFTEPSQGPCNACEPLPGPLLAAASGGAVEEPVLVLSARRALLWSVGSSAEEIGVLDLASLSRRSFAVPDGVELGRVLSATYAPGLDSLLVLDEVGGGRGRGRGRRSARLLRIDALGRDAEVLASWPRPGWSRRFAMGTDPSGALWIAASGDRGGPHVVVRLALSEAGVHALGFRAGGGVLAAELLRAGRAGVSLVVADARGRDAPVGYRAEALLPARDRDVGRCF